MHARMISPMGGGLRLGLSMTGGGTSFDYYVDSVNGSDANNGTSAATAFQTFSKVQPLLTTGKKVRLSGSFKEKLTITANNVLVDGGSTTETVIDCSDVISAGSWTKTAGRTNVYQVDLNVQTDAVAAEWPAIWCNGTRLAFVADLATLDTTPSSFYCATYSDVTPITVYINAPGSTNPASDGKTYEAAIRSTGIDTYAATGCTVRNLRTKRPYTSFGGVALGRSCYGQNLRCSEGNTHNIYYRQYCTLDNVLCDDAYNWTASPIPFVGYEGTPSADAWATLNNCTATCSTYTQNFNGFYNHTGGGSNWNLITYNNCNTTNCGTGISGANCNTITVNGGTLTTYGTGITTSSTTLNINGVTFGTANVGGVIVLSGVSGQTVNITGCSANPNTTGNVRSIHTNTVFNLTNNTFTAFNQFTLGSASGQTWNISGNTFNPGGRGSVVYNLTGASLTLASDNNNFGGNTTGDFVIGGTTYPDFTSYKTGTGQDAHSVN